MLSVWAHGRDPYISFITDSSRHHGFIRATAMNVLEEKRCRDEMRLAGPVERMWHTQGYLAHKKEPPPRTLQ